VQFDSAQGSLRYQQTVNSYEQVMNNGAEVAKSQAGKTEGVSQLKKNQPTVIAYEAITF